MDRHKYESRRRAKESVALLKPPYAAKEQLVRQRSSHETGEEEKARSVQIL